MSSRVFFLGLMVLLLIGLRCRADAETYPLTLNLEDRKVTIAVGDTLVITSNVAGTARIIQSSGVIGGPIPVHIGDHRSFYFPKSGRFSGIISDSAGATLAQLDVQVVSTTLSSKAIADEIGFSRSVILGVQPSGAAISFKSSDPTLLTLTNQAINGTTASFMVKTLARGTPKILATIISPGGPRTKIGRAHV